VVAADAVVNVKVIIDKITNNAIKALSNHFKESPGLKELHKRSFIISLQNLF